MLKQESLCDKMRQFICPCSKSYYSYAALFTHIKQKHDGKAPGQIIKPKSENKRGRPRKNPIKESSTVDCGQTEKLAEKVVQGVGQGKSTFQLGNNKFNLKSTPGSQFKIYKKINSSSSTSHSFSQQNSFQYELIRDLSRYLEIRSLVQVPSYIIDEVQASRYLDIGEESDDGALEQFRSFLVLCRNGLKAETFSQVSLLLSMLLQHIMEAKGMSKPLIDSGEVHEHVVSFFDYINRFSREVDLSEYGIFNDLNTIKTLIVFFNWLGKLDKETNVSDEESHSWL